MFVGHGRVAEVERLVTRFGQVRRESTPALVTYVAPPGWGKTRVIQEFYRRLAESQPEPRYWPASLITEPRTGASTSGDLATGRKAVRHRQLQVPPDTAAPWLWLALPSARLGDNSPAPAVEQLATQLIPHLPQLVGRLARAGHPIRPVCRAIAGVLSPWELRTLAAADPALGAAIAGEGPLAATADLATGVATLLRLLQGPLPPAERTGTVVVLDDAHDLDQSAVNLVADLLSADLPALLIATTWPEHVRTDASGSPFATYLADAATTERAALVHLDLLGTDDLVEFVLHQFPGTDPMVANRLAQRADRNPYALRLLLDTALVRSASRDGRIDLGPAEIDQLNGGLDDLLRQHWTRLSIGVQQTLVTTALLGESVLDDVLVAALGAVRPEGGLSAALATAWIRPTGEPARIFEFIERIRYDVARGAAPNVLTTSARENVLASALRAVRQLLEDDVREARQVLLALHVGLTRAGVETDLPSAGRSAADLAEIARGQHRRLDAISYLEQAVVWLETGDASDRRHAIRLRLELTATVRIEHSRSRSEPHAVAALELADQLPDTDELRIRARLALARALLRRNDRERFDRAYELLREAERRTDVLDEPSRGLIRDLWSFQASAAGHQGRYAEATKRCEELLAHCEQRYGPGHRYTLDAMEDLSYNAMRSDDIDRAVAVRREILRRRTGLISEAGYLPTLPARSNLAAALMRVGTHAALDEAEQLALEAKTAWSRSYGVDGTRTQRTRMILARILQCRGLLLEDEGDRAAAGALFERAHEETGKLYTLRLRREVTTQPIALMRHGISQACLRDEQAIASLTEALRLREVELKQSRDYWEVRECASHLVWAYDRLGLPLEAAATRRIYRLATDG
ncbi:hypothetical protein GCM10010399_90440 [Dactylosporangium fulvum]|uniref:AAA family ATPase n=1 Tax=Dactylosporangium fulvum TaxID=53359 RepID=A0ABY5W6G9_9ACTN|nr:tetratricopeptide repeat protein [Dactylosporangium fulvum]UWP85059.1 AAA family ATPase [Dactylosporangium fulvum]